MFTGLVEEKGRVIAVDEHGDAVRLRFAGPLVTSDATHGASIAVNGACLTAIDVVGEEFSADVMAESLAKTTLGDLRVGDEVNLERAMSLGDRLGGHIVQGHVDGTGEVLERLASEHWEIVWFSAPAHVAKYLVSKGSVTVDGTSLTVVEVEDAGGQHRFSVSLIPTTLTDTVLGDRPVGARVNLEADILAKHVERLITPELRPEHLREGQAR